MKLESLMSIVAGAAMALGAGVLAASPAHAVAHFEVRRNGVAIDGHGFLVSMGVQGQPKKLVY